MTSPVPMTADRWRAVDAILKGALARPVSERAAFVREACESDDALRREVESLLAAHEEAGDAFLEAPAIQALAPGRWNPRAVLAQALAGRYAIDSEIAQGGMATVYAAHDLRHGRRVAIKVMNEAVAQSVGVERFLEEIRVTAALQHPHILPLFESGSAHGLLWYTMPLVEGETLRTRIAREGQLPVEEAVRLAREIAGALDHAHERGIVHRDVKPENVLLQNGHALVADFGIALALDHAGDRLTRTGLTLGTPNYMAPEQAEGERAVDARADVYALGAVLYEMLTGAPPFAGGSRQVVVQRMLHETPAPLAARRSGIPPALDATVRRALARRPNLRFPNAAAFAAALAEERPEPTPPALPAPADDSRTMARVAAGVALVAFVLGVASGWGLARSTLFDRAPSEPAPEAQTSALGASIAAGTTVRGAGAGTSTLAVVDRTGRLLRTIPAERPWTPRFSPDGKRVAYGAFGSGRRTSDLWVTDLESGETQRLTDDRGDDNDPQWSPDGNSIAYSVNAPSGKDVVVRQLTGADAAATVPARRGVQFASDWLRDGSALMVTEDAGDRGRGYDILVQPLDGSAAKPYVATPANETAARVSPDRRWVAYTSDATGRAEVYLDRYPSGGHPVQLSRNGGAHPVWRGDGGELYYWHDGALLALPIGRARGGLPSVGAEVELFRAPYQLAPNTMYDVSADGQRFVIVRQR